MTLIFLNGNLCTSHLEVFLQYIWVRPEMLHCKVTSYSTLKPLLPDYTFKFFSRKQPLTIIILKCAFIITFVFKLIFYLDNGCFYIQVSVY